MGLFQDLWGTVKSTFQIAIGGVKLKNNSGDLTIRNAADNADADIQVAELRISGEQLEINSDAAGSGADWKYTITRPTSGMTANVSLMLPPTDGSPSQVLQTNGSGVLDWASAATTENLVHVETTTVAHGNSSPLAMFTLPANSVVHQVEMILDIAWDGTAPTMSVGVAGTASKYMGSTDMNLKGSTKDRFMVHPGEAADASPEDLIITFAGDGSANGSSRIVVYYSIPA